MKENTSVDAEEIERFSKIAEEWWNPHGKFKPLHDLNPVRLQFIRDAIGVPLSGLALLDIGCGGGLVAEPMARLGAHVTAIDAAEKNIAVASLHAQNMGLAIDYRNTTAEALVAQGAQFDIVLALEIVEHVADVAAFVASCAALVKPGGLLFMSTLNRTIKSYALAIVGAEYVLRWLPRGTHTWNKFLKPSELHTHLRTNNISVTQQCGVVFNPLKREWLISQSDLDVNYMLVGRKG